MGGLNQCKQMTIKNVQNRAEQSRPTTDSDRHKPTYTRVGARFGFSSLSGLGSGRESGLPEKTQRIPYKPVSFRDSGRELGLPELDSGRNSVRIFQLVSGMGQDRVGIGPMLSPSTKVILYLLIHLEYFQCQVILNFQPFSDMFI